MIVFAFVAVGYVLGRRTATLLRRHGRTSRTQNLTVACCLTAGTVARTLVEPATGGIEPETLLLHVYRFLLPALGGFLASALAGAVLILVLAFVLYGICISAGVVILILGQLLLGRSRGDGLVEDRPFADREAPVVHDDVTQVSIVSAWRSATAAYGQAVATALHATIGRDVRLQVCGVDGIHLHVDAEGIRAQWNSLDGWSAMTLRGRHWYPETLVPAAGEIAQWLREVGDAPQLGLGWPPDWRAGDNGDDDAAAGAEEDILNRLVAAVSEQSANE